MLPLYVRPALTNAAKREFCSILFNVSVQLLDIMYKSVQEIDRIKDSVMVQMVKKVGHTRKQASHGKTGSPIK